MNNNNNNYCYKILSLQYPNSKSKYTYGDDSSKYIGYTIFILQVQVLKNVFDVGFILKALHLQLSSCS